VQEILDYLRANGEQRDSQLAKGLRMPLDVIQKGLHALAGKGELITCDLILVEDGKEVRKKLYRASGFIPPKAPGPKPK